MASNKIEKGNKVQLSTFLKWDVHDIFGHKIIEEGGSKFVNFVWCKLCAKTGIEINNGRLSMARRFGLYYFLTYIILTHENNTI